MTPEEAGRLIAQLVQAGYLLPSRREMSGIVLESTDEFVVGPAMGAERVTVLDAIRRHSDGPGPISEDGAP